MAAELPPENMYDILSRLPVKSLARFRCVSKLWCKYINDSYLETMHARRAVINDPILLLFSQFPPDHPPNSPCTLHFLEYKDEAGTCALEMTKKPPTMEFMCEIEEYKYLKGIVLGSCSGLLYSSQHQTIGCNHVATTLVVIHPMLRECYELPPINTQLHPKPPWWHIKWCVELSCGLGFDDSTNTFKMVCVVPGESPCTMVHVLGTDSWRKIPQVPSSRIMGEGVFINGCLHWLPQFKHEYCRLVITFEMKTEEFGWIKPPREILPGQWLNVHLVNLHGQLGHVYIFINSSSSVCVEVWVLKERGWVMHCQFEPKLSLVNYSRLNVLGFWNENGDILLLDKMNIRFFVYNLKGHSLYEVSFVGLEHGRAKDIRMFQSRLFTTRYTIRKLKDKTLA